MKNTFVIIGLATIHISFAWSKTIALWPIDNQPAGALNSRCLVESLHNLSNNGGATNEAFGASVPNPDTTAFLFDNSTTNVGAARMANRQFYNSVLGWKTDLTNSFTVEGWYKVTTEPTPSVFHYIAGPRGNNIGGWMLSLRSKDSKTLFSLYARNGLGATAVLVNDHYFDSTDLSGDRDWHHLALTYSHNIDNGVWKLYLDGSDIGTVTNSAATSTQNHGNFYLGGRGANYMDGFLDFWRVSDTALAPSEFLNYPAEVPPQPSTPKTLAYWRFDQQSGTNDLKSYVTATYRMRIFGTAPVASSENFAAVLPNSDKSADFIGNARTNIGSVCYDSSVAGRYMSAANLGLKVDLTNSFTAEGWVKRTANPGANFFYVAGARDAGTGWMLTLRNDNSSIRYHLHVNRGTGTNLDTYFPVGNVTTDMGWQHVALTYDCTLAGLGVWELFVNGTSSGTLTNTGLPTASHGINAFNLCGRAAGANTFIGYYDCWRVTDSVLVPTQLLNASIDQPLVPRTLAYWKLDAPAGVLDLSSSVDARFRLLNANGGATATNIQVRTRILNPDTSMDFIGNPTNNTGAVFFRQPGTPPNSRCTFASYLGLSIDPARSFTTEGWIKLYDEPASDQIFFVVGNRRSSNGWMLTLRHDASTQKTRFHLFAQSPDGLNLEQFFTATDVTDKRDWIHLALVHDRVASDLGTWELFMDGASQGVITNNVFARATFPSFDFQLGGRVDGGVGNDSTPACYDSWRVVDYPLSPTHFLNHGFPGGTIIRVK